MAIIHQKDKRSGITYAYESISTWDKVKKQSRSKRRLIGRVDDATGQIVPTDGRNRKAKAKSSKEPTTYPHQYFDASYLLDQLADQVGVKQDLKTCFGDLADIILSVADYWCWNPKTRSIVSIIGRPITFIHMVSLSPSNKAVNCLRPLPTSRLTSSFACKISAAAKMNSGLTTALPFPAIRRP